MLFTLIAAYASLRLQYFDVSKNITPSFFPFCVSLKTCEKGFTYFLFNLTYIIFQMIVGIFMPLTKKSGEIKEVAYLCLYVILFTMIFYRFRSSKILQQFKKGYFWLYSLNTITSCIFWDNIFLYLSIFNILIFLISYTIPFYIAIYFLSLSSTLLLQIKNFIVVLKVIF